MTNSRRPRGTPEKAHADIQAAIARLAKGRTDRTAERLTATALAHEAGMSRKQLYHYFEEVPVLASAWHELRDQRKNGLAEKPSTANRRIRELEQALQAWKSVAAIARAEAERQAEINDTLRAENDRLRDSHNANPGQVLPFPRR